MTADMVIRFFENYGWIMTVLATSGIIIVGVLKALGLFSKLNSKAKKYIYFACSCIVSIIACTIYLCVKNAFVWADWGMTSACIICYTMAIYGLYENMGLRAILKKIFFTPTKNLFKNLLSLIVSKSISKERLILLAKNLGSDILAQLASEAQNGNAVYEPAQEAIAANMEKQSEISNHKTENDRIANSQSNTDFLKSKFFS